MLIVNYILDGEEFSRTMFNHTKPWRFARYIENLEDHGAIITNIKIYRK